MTRSFTSTPIDRSVIDGLVDLASRAPSAGKVQGWHLIVLEGLETARFWDITLPEEKRSTFRWGGLISAPVIALPLADSSAYVARYSEADKVSSGLGDGPDSWPVPYWTIDTAMSVMTVLLGAQDIGLGALFFGVFQNELKLRSELGVPDDLELLGAIALGHPRDVDDGGNGQSRSSTRRRRSPDEIIHRGGW